MSDYDNTNSGVLFKNDKGDNDRRPDYSGKINVEGKEFQLAAWIKDGARGKFMSLKVSEPYQQESQSPTSPPSEDFDDSIPF